MKLRCCLFFLGRGVGGVGEGGGGGGGTYRAVHSMIHWKPPVTHWSDNLILAGK